MRWLELHLQLTFNQLRLTAFHLHRQQHQRQMINGIYVETVLRKMESQVMIP